MRHLCESGLRENCTGRLCGGRRSAPGGASSDPTGRLDAAEGPNTERGWRLNLDDEPDAG